MNKFHVYFDLNAKKGCFSLFFFSVLKSRVSQFSKLKCRLYSTNTLKIYVPQKRRDHVCFLSVSINIVILIKFPVFLFSFQFLSMFFKNDENIYQTHLKTDKKKYCFIWISFSHDSQSVYYESNNLNNKK